MSGRHAIDSPVPHDLLPPWSRTRLVWVLIAALLVAALAAAAPFAVPRRAAEPPGPLASLAAAERSRRWDLGFWTGEEAAGTELWRGAVAWCRSRREHDRPNCTTVRLASWWGPSAPPAWWGVPPAPADVAAPAADASVVADSAPSARDVARHAATAAAPNPAPPAAPAEGQAVRR